MKFYSFLLLLSVSLFSCSNDDNDLSTSNKTGRFDNKPFVWDVNIDGDQNQSFIMGGDTYVGAVYQKESVNNRKFDNESQQARNQIDLIFDFLYVDSVTNETGSVGYSKALSRALESSQFRKQSQRYKRINHYKITEYYTDNDLSKAFENQSELFEYSKSKIEDNRKSFAITSKLVSLLIRTNASVYMDYPANGIFKDIKYNDETINPSNIFTHSIIYGKTAYLVAESEYSYLEIKGLVTKLIYQNFVTENLTTTETDILSKSTITICEVNKHPLNSSFINKIENFRDLLQDEIESTSFGYPVYAQFRTLDNKI